MFVRSRLHHLQLYRELRDDAGKWEQMLLIYQRLTPPVVGLQGGGHSLLWDTLGLCKYRKSPYTDEADEYVVVI